MAQEPDAIREEIEDTRERMSETVDALSYKTDVKSRMKNAVSSQKDKLMGTVSDNTPDPGQVKEKAKQGVGIAKENPPHSPRWPRARLPRRSTCTLHAHGGREDR